jgi:16S rRNA C1402 N4-methylase RsmH
MMLLGETFQRHAGTLGQRGFARLLLAVLGNAARLVAVGDDHKLIARLGQAFHAQDFHGR